MQVFIVIKMLEQDCYSTSLGVLTLSTSPRGVGVEPCRRPRGSTGCGEYQGLAGTERGGGGEPGELGRNPGSQVSHRKTGTLTPTLKTHKRMHALYASETETTI